MLLGRERECALLDALVSQVRSGTSAAIVVTGDPGIGKTSLLEHAASRAAGFRILRARGAESEQDLPFAGLADLLGPVLGLMRALPDRQREALAGALAVGPAAAADRFAVCAATLGLLAAAAAEGAVLALVDDAHWLDAGSAQAIVFAARRLGADSVGLVIAVRNGAGGSFDPSRFDSLPVTGLDRAAARQLLARTGRPVAAAVAERIVAGAGGNPLALVEVPSTLSDEQLTGVKPLPEPLPLTPGLRLAFARRLDAAGDNVRLLLLLAAADTAADLSDLGRAAGFQSLDLDGFIAAEQADLIRLGRSRVEFAHPLLRSAAYHTAGRAERQAAHRALARACGPGRDPIRHAWHLAAAAVGPDENVAESLDLAAEVALRRNAYAVAARASQRAAELTADPGIRVIRLMAAGQAAHLGGDRQSAAELLTLAINQAADPRVKADAQMMRGYATQWTSAPAAHYEQIVAEAEAVLPVDPFRAASLLSLAAGVCIMSGRLGVALEIATRAAELTRERDQPGWLESHAWLGATTILTGGRLTGLPLITSILDHPAMAGSHPAVFVLRTLCSQSLMWCEDYRRAAEILRTNIDDARTLGRVADLTYALAVLSDLSFRTGEWDMASASASEGAELSSDYTTAGDTGFALANAARVDAAMGAAEQCRERLDNALLIMTTGAEPILTYVTAALGLLELGLGNFKRASAELARTERWVTQDRLADPNVVHWRPDYIESLHGSGEPGKARQQLLVLEAEAAATGSRWADAVAARCSGLLQDKSNDAISALEHAVSLAEAGWVGAFDLARARLCLGEALRRAGKRSDARRPLAQAHTAFEQLGAAPWAKRAAAELAATGITAARRHSPAHVRLTPQELRVAMQVAEGYSNQEVAARLFLSPKTIEVHLSHIYAKLGLRSRTALAREISSGAISDLPR